MRVLYIYSNIQNLILFLWILLFGKTVAQEPWKELAVTKYELRFYQQMFNKPSWSRFRSSREFCKNLGGDLVQLDDSEVKSAVYTTIESAPVDYFWIGATGQMFTWIWLDQSPVNLSQLTWYENQPDNYNNNEKRMIIRNKDNKIGDIILNFEHAGTICQRKRVVSDDIYTLTFYRFDSSGNSYLTNFDSAKQACGLKESRLVILNDSKKKLIREILVSNNEVYWVDQESTQFCTVIRNNNEVNKECTEAHHYICEQSKVYSIILTTSDIEVSTVGGIIITCTAFGFPVPSVQWTRNGTIVTIDQISSVYQTSRNGNSILYLQNASLVDEGEYTCIARNSFAQSNHQQNISANVRVPSHPIISSVTPQSCNSSLAIKWKPHVRAIGLQHRFFLKDLMKNMINESFYITPNTSLLQTVFSGNLSSSSSYEITIIPCSIYCYSYVTRNVSRTGGIPESVTNATLTKKNKICCVSWSWPEYTPRNILNGYNIILTSSFAVAPKGANSPISTSDLFVGSSTLSYDIPNHPNRNYSVSIQSKTCAGFGPKVAARGVCVTDLAAPTLISKPQGSGNILENGTMTITVDPPDETNGPINCIFIIVKADQSSQNENPTIRLQDLEKMSNSTSSDEYIAIATDLKRIKLDKSKLSFSLGDGSKTECIINKRSHLTKREAITNSSNDVYIGNNQKLNLSLSYQISIVTATLSGSDILLQVSESIKINKGQNDKPDWLIPVIVALAFFLVIIFSVGCIYYSRKSKKPKESLKPRIVTTAATTFSAISQNETTNDQRITDDSPYESVGNLPRINTESAYENESKETSGAVSESCNTHVYEYPSILIKSTTPPNTRINNDKQDIAADSAYETVGSFPPVIYANEPKEHFYEIPCGHFENIPK